MKLSYLLLLVILGCATKPVEVVPGPSKRPWLADSTRHVSQDEVAIYARPYIVQHGDWLSKIALTEYGDTTKWHRIFAWNRQWIGDRPDRIYPYQLLQLRKAVEYTGHTYYRIHTIQAGETLWSIAALYYGDPRAWILIFHDNRGTMRGVGNLQIGSNLRVRRG